MKNPLVSICIPNYNYEIYIADSINSAINQTYPNIEVIVVDNHSEDKSFEIISALGQENRIRTYRNDRNIGMVPNFNKCLTLSRGEFLVFLSADDLLHSDFVCQTIKMFRDDSVGMVAAHCDGIDNCGKISPLRPFYEESGIIPGQEHSRVFLMTGIYFPSQVLLRRSVLDKVGGWNARFPIFFDWNMWFNVSRFSNIAYIKDTLAFYRQHQANATTEAISSMQMIFEKFLLKLDFFSKLDCKSDLYSHKSEAIKKLAHNCCHYAAELIKREDYNLASKYLQLAPVFDHTIADHENFKLMSYSLTIKSKRPADVYTEISEYFEDFESKRPFSLPYGSYSLSLR
jgi:glycosyltransferase involved in cell wall biosynthesis